MVRTLESRIEIAAPVDEVFRFLTSPENVPAFAPGIEEASLAGGVAGHEGAHLALTTRRGRTIGAQIVWLRENRGWAVVDEHGTQNGFELEALPDGRTLVVNTLRGAWPDTIADRVEAEASEKIRALPRLLGRPSLLKA